jgi:hypothetical protein
MNPLIPTVVEQTAQGERTFDLHLICRSNRLYAPIRRLSATRRVARVAERVSTSP